MPQKVTSMPVIQQGKNLLLSYPLILSENQKLIHMTTI